MHDAGKHLFIAMACSGAAAFYGCGGSAALPQPPRVDVTPAPSVTAPSRVDYAGITAASESVQVRARVTGYLLERLFRDGQDVAQNDLLFIIQSDQFEAAVQQATAVLARDEAELAHAHAQVERYRPLAAQQYISRENFAENLTRVRTLEASVAADRAALAETELELSYTQIRAPISGRIGRHLVDVGNLVGAGEATLLTTIVQLDPIYLYFSPTKADLPTLLEQHRSAPLSVRAILPGTGEHPHIGRVDFINNQIDRNTATIKMRASLPNPDKALLPGQVAKVRLLREQFDHAAKGASVSHGAEPDS